MAEADATDRMTAAGLGDAEMRRRMGWPRHVEAMLDVERALAGAVADVGLVDASAALAVERACDPSRLDLAALTVAAAQAASPVIPLVAAIGASLDDAAGRALHRGATSQDVVDTATTLQVREALDRLEDLLLAAADRCARLASDHAGTVMAGRTLGQQAVPITFGLLCARWLAALDRRVVVLRRWRADHLTVQLGGASGTAGALGDDGLAVARAVADRLGLGVPTLPLHGERDHIADLAGALGATAGVVGKVAGDLVQLAGTEVAEVGFGDGGPTSSAMPHKRNPVDAVAAAAAARLAVTEAGGLAAATADHRLERAAGAWQAEWVALPSALERTAGALRRLTRALELARPDEARMRRNLDLGLGLVASEALAGALGDGLGRGAAARLVADLAAEASGSGRTLAEVAAEHADVRRVLGDDGLRSALDPASTLRTVPELIARALADHAAVVAA